MDARRGYPPEVNAQTPRRLVPFAGVSIGFKAKYSGSGPVKEF
jgi:hypothetical protein